MIQLVNKNINTTYFTNTVLRNIKNDNLVILREKSKNTPIFTKYSIFKDLVLDIARQFNSERITEVAIIKVSNSEKGIKLGLSENRAILVLDGDLVLNKEERLVIETGSLLWLNEDVTYNTTNKDCFILVLDLKEFML